MGCYREDVSQTQWGFTVLAHSPKRNSKNNFWGCQDNTTYRFYTQHPNSGNIFQNNQASERNKGEGNFKAEKMSRTLPNIIITGTPGTGKTSHCELLAERTGLKHLSVNQVVKDRECHEGWDEEYQSWVVDEDKVGFFLYLPLKRVLTFRFLTSSIYL